MKPAATRIGDWSATSGYQAAQQLMRAGQEFSAIFSQNDRMAVGAIRALCEAGAGLVQAGDLDLAQECLDRALADAGGDGEIERTVSTGYGRRNVSFALQDRTEIGCHAKGCFQRFPEAITIIDIGGQDNKVIKLDASGRRTNFKMNRKCAAGTGAFLEEIATRLDLEVGDLEQYARGADKQFTLGSFCTVFAKTEILAKIREGVAPADLARKWRLNLFLSKWLSYCVREGHRFPLDAPAADGPVPASLEAC